MLATPPGPIRILLVIHNLATHGGAENQLEYLARGLAGLGHDVTLCCIEAAWRDLRPLQDAGVEVVELGARTRLARLRAIPRLARLARRAQVVQCTMWDASLWARIAAIIARRPVVVAEHSTDRSVQVTSGGASRKAWIAAHNRLLDPFTFATVSCATSQEELLRGEGVSPEKLVHIANGLPIADVEAEAERSPDRAELDIPEGAKVVMQVGVFRHEKNQAGSLEALNRLRDRFDDFVLVFVGDGVMRGPVERRAGELGADWVRFLGFREDVPALLGLADLMVLPSSSDAMPLTVLEAMALGVPVVASDVGDVRLNLDGGGICIPPGDLTALEAACERLLTDDGARARLGAAGRERARRYDAAAMAGHYSELFERAVSGGSPGTGRYSR